MLNFDSPWKIAELVGALIVLRVVFTLWRMQPAMRRGILEFLDSALIAFALVFLLIRPFVVQSFYIPSESMLPTLRAQDRILVNKFIYRLNAPRSGDVVVFVAPPAATAGQDDGLKKDFIKRLIGLPGDRIEVRRSRIVIAGEEIEREDLAARLGIYSAGQIKLVPDGVVVDGQRFGRAEIARREGVAAAQVKITPGRVYRNGKPLVEPYIQEDPKYAYPTDDLRLPTGKPHVVPPGCVFVMGDNRNNSNDSHHWGDLEASRLLGRAMVIFWPLSRIQLID
jgi:signal peptidase I